MALSGHALTLVTLVLGYLSLVVRSWTLRDNYNGSSWSQGMHLETRATNSEYVNYLTRDVALTSGLLANRRGQLYLGVDSTTVLSPSSGVGRNSVRLRTNKTFNVNTLVIGDFAHIPGNACGIWPSFWMVGPVWPKDGEIDILEGVNEMTQNQITIHSHLGCAPKVGPAGETGKRTGKIDCGENGGDIGCGVFNTKPEGWGNGFNAAGGGVYAMLWTPDGIKVWSWKQNEVPANVRQDKPKPETWGTPVANWSGCNFGEEYFNNMGIIVNTAFCGGWAGEVWKQGSCGALAPTCYEYAAANPQAYKEAYWLINSIKVYSP